MCAFYGNSWQNFDGVFRLWVSASRAEMQGYLNTYTNLVLRGETKDGEIEVGGDIKAGVLMGYVRWDQMSREERANFALSWVDQYQLARQQYEEFQELDGTLVAEFSVLTLLAYIDYQPIVVYSDNPNHDKYRREFLLMQLAVNRMDINNAVLKNLVYGQETFLDSALESLRFDIIEGRLQGAIDHWLYCSYN